MEGVRDLSIRVPWGNVAGKIWGADNHKNVLVVHGVLDNAGSFDRLIPLLPQNLKYVCIDLPGHGYSSHFDHGLTLNYLNYILTIRYVLDELQWDDVYYMGHSFGAHVGCLFTIVYPGRIKKLILIDGIIPRCIEDENITRKIRHEHDLAIQAYEKNSQSLYTKDQILYALKNLRKCALKFDAAEAIFTRSVTRVDDDSFYYNRDFRARFGIFPYFNQEQNLYLLRHLRAETLVIFATDTLPFVATVRDEAKKVLSKLKNVEIVEVKGNHDVHNNYPERISNYISNFLGRTPSKL
ncbi:hypothetical protein QAD02_003992 [Eretmocerus hayati]|uniref:Uncharacterized protein n=1 Tax=Eretmocerus hayati TaxID=131215 RepID=A0ACC2NR45_9HYME|nr:hypothetical protein QAD02_003992 [Eretmocerus hayati]